MTRIQPWTISRTTFTAISTTFSVSMTTRKPREGEVDGVSYFFKTKEEFEQEIERGGLLEYAAVYENYCGTPKAYVEEKLEAES